jgi:hypothetical protein
MPKPLSHETLLNTLFYDPETGIFTWKISHPKGRPKFGDQAGTISRGYRSIQISGSLYRGCRLAWFYQFGEWPNIIDHINGNRADDRIVNLRNVDHRTNNENRRKAMPNNIAGLIGASFNDGKWIATIKVNGDRLYLGRYATPTEAHNAYVAAKRMHHMGCTI